MSTIGERRERASAGWRSITTRRVVRRLRAAVDAPLAVGVTLEPLSRFGVLLMRTTFDRHSRSGLEMGLAGFYHDAGGSLD